MKILILILLVASPCVHAANKKINGFSRKPNQVSLEGFSTEVIFGDQVSSFKVWKNNSGYHVDISSSEKSKKSVAISEKNFRYLLEQASSVLLEESNDSSYCMRNQIVLKSLKAKETAERVGCIGSPTPVAKKLTELANTLVLLN